MPGRHLPPDRSAGDESTLGGYMAVHARPAAFDGPDGLPYSVDVLTDETGDSARPFAAYLLFMQWRRMGEPGIETHAESEFLFFGDSPAAARAAIGAMTLHQVKEQLDLLIRTRSGGSGRRWYEAMRAEEGERGSGREGEGA